MYEEVHLIRKALPQILASLRPGGASQQLTGSKTLIAQCIVLYMHTHKKRSLGGKNQLTLIGLQAYTHTHVHEFMGRTFSSSQYKNHQSRQILHLGPCTPRSKTQLILKYYSLLQIFYCQFFFPS